MESLRRELATAQAQFTELQTRYKSRHPLYARAEERIAALEKSIRYQTQSTDRSELASTTSAEAVNGQAESGLSHCNPGNREKSASVE